MTFPTWTLQDRITKARTHAGLNKGELAKKMGLSVNTLGRWESGANTPTEKNLQALAEATGVPVEWFYQDETAQPSQTTTPQRFLVEVSGDTLTASPLAD